MCQIVDGARYEGFVTGGKDPADRRPVRTGKMREETGIKIALYAVIGLSQTALSALSTKSCRKPGGAVGEIF